MPPSLATNVRLKIRFAPRNQLENFQDLLVKIKFEGLKPKGCSTMSILQWAGWGALSINGLIHALFCGPLPSPLFCPPVSI
jgi:hypothetical protein